MKLFAEVVVPGPWWNKLSYLTDVSLPQGIRVSVNVGRTTRTGFVSRVHSDEASIEFDVSRLRSVKSVIDRLPPLPSDLWMLSEWIGKAYLCGQGEALSVICPPFLLKGAETVGSEISPPSRTDSVFESRTVYSEIDNERYEAYLDAIANARGASLILFPEQDLARNFHESLPDELKHNSLLWPSTGGKKLWNDWNYVRSDFNGLVIGTQSAAFAPLRDIALIIVEEEASGAYVQHKFPFLNIKSIIGKRAELSRSELILGGRLPSSRVYLNKRPIDRKRHSDPNTTFVDIRATDPANLAGISRSFRISETALRETGKSLHSSRVVLWILDRKGYAGEVACEECGRSVECAHCGGTFNWDKDSDRMKCSLCGAVIGFPEQCPYCRGSLIIGKRAGIDALCQIANEIVVTEKPVVKWHSAYPGTVKESRKTISSLSDGGLVIGSRLALRLCDLLPVGCIIWIDADSEARKPFYNSHFKAFSMVWESRWRGVLTEQRRVIVQSRMPGKGWQRALTAGWDYFWKKELSERKELGLPPFTYLIRMDLPDERSKQEIMSSLIEKGLDVMDPGGNGDESFRIWLSSYRISPVISALDPFFRITRSGRGFPAVRIYTD